MKIKQAEFKDSAYTAEQYSPSGLPEIAIVGRSNSGKSSLINKICNNRKLARVSSEPGKTRSVNFFEINREFMLVDLPGYGFAKRGAQEKESWGRLVEGYFAASENLLHLLLLCDIRHDPSEGDLAMVNWLRYYDIPFTLIATKCDKIAKSKRRGYVDKLVAALGAASGIAFSALDGTGKEDVLDRVSQIIDGGV